MNWSTMMLSMLAAGIASQHYGTRTIGAALGLAQFFDGDLLGLGKLERQTAGAGSDGRRCSG